MNSIMTLPSENILEMFFEVTHVAPNQVAIELNEQTWTYSELLMNTIYVARHLHIEIGEIVYQYVDRSLEMVCGILGIMCAGGAYCPLNTDNPPLYIRALIDGIRGRYVLVHENTRRRFLSTINEQIEIINLEHILLINTTEEEIIEKRNY
jgi:non-ribosomal peptide synthetase component F